jgi:hypothetical protein
MKSRIWKLVSIGLVLMLPSFAGGDFFGTVGLHTDYGADSPGSHVMVGGGESALFAHKRLGIFGEFNYIPYGELFGITGVSFKQIEAGGGVRLYFGSNDRIRIYIPMAGGYARFSGSESGVSAGVNGGTFGGGLGAEIGSGKVGIRPEFRYVREQFGSLAGNGGGGTNATRLTVSVFYRFGR